MGRRIIWITFRKLEALPAAGRLERLQFQIMKTTFRHTICYKNIGYLNNNKPHMKNLLLIVVFLFLGKGLISAQESNTVTLTIEIEVTKYNKGSILLALYNSEESYMKTPYKAAKAEVVNNKAVISFENIEKGSYTFSMFHDVNDNKKMDKNFMGIPKEPYGFSNNQKGRFGPPDYEKVVFDVNENQTLQVSIK